jgi:hypothetical protein
MHDRHVYCRLRPRLQVGVVTERSAHPDAKALAYSLMHSVLNSGHDSMRQFADLTDLQERLSAAITVIADERSTMLVDIREEGESVASVARRVEFLKADRVADLLRRGERIRAEDGKP